MKITAAAITLLIAGLILGAVSGQQSSQLEKEMGILGTGKTAVSEEEALQALAHGRLIPVENDYLLQYPQKVDSSSLASTSPLVDELNLDAIEGSITFASTRGGSSNYDIFIQGVDSGSASGLVSSSGDDTTPVWSPDGDEMVFASNRDGDYDIYRRLENGDEINLTNNPAEDIHPSWSPDGDGIIFSSNMGGSYFQIYTVDLNSSNLQRIEVPGTNAMWPRYSPDASTIAFMRSSITTPACDWNWDVWLMNVNGSNQRRLTTQIGGDVYPEWTPDGQGIVYASCRYLIAADLYRKNPTTGSEFQLTSSLLDNEWGASFSPDEAHFAFNGDASGNTDIYIMPSGGGASFNLTANPNEDVSPSWSTLPAAPPDSDQLLAERFKPTMYFHGGEDYRPMPVSTTLEHANLDSTIEGLGPVNEFNLDTLMSPTWNKESSYLDLEGEGPAEIQHYYIEHVKPGLQPVVYARVDRRAAPNYIAIQYWFYYYDNPWINHHEGDWEMVQVVLDGDENPLYAAYSQHFAVPLLTTGGTKRPWNHVNRDDTHPYVFVARGSHASYFRPFYYWQGEGVLPCLGIDSAVTDTNVQDNMISPTIQMLPESISADTWPYFKGRWGHIDVGSCPLGNEGPRGPVWSSPVYDSNVIDFKPAWEDPIGWSEGLDWDEDAHHNLIKLWVSAPVPYDVHLIDVITGKHVGWNASPGDIIPTGEYFDNPETGRRTILVHEFEPSTPENPRYLVIYTLRSPNSSLADSSTGDLLINEPLTTTVSIPDLSNNTVLSATYTISGDWTISTTGTISLYHGSILTMAVDLDGDGSVDQQLLPDSMEEITVDLTPPDKIDDLEVVDVQPGKVTLRWTATGDDEQMGTAAYYDIRYSNGPISQLNWTSAKRVVGPLNPAQAGEIETHTIAKLSAGTYYYAVSAVDDAGLYSSVSNSVQANVSGLAFLPYIEK